MGQDKVLKKGLCTVEIVLAGYTLYIYICIRGSDFGIGIRNRRIDKLKLYRLAWQCEQFFVYFRFIIELNCFTNCKI